MQEGYEELACKKRESKMTEKAVEEKVHRLTQSRKAKLGHLTSQANHLERLMEDDANVNTVKQKLRLDYQDSIGELCKINDALTHVLYGEELETDQSSWYEPKLIHVRGFMQPVEMWIKAAEERAKQAKECDAAIQPADSVSMVSSAQSSYSRKRGSAVGSKVSSTSSVRLKAEVERATLLAQAAALKQKQELERQEAELKAKREALELQTAIAASDAKLKVLENYEIERVTCTHVSPVGGMTIESGYLPLGLPVGQNPVINLENGQGEFRPLQPQSTAVQQSSGNFVTDDYTVETLCSVMTRQNNITELMVKQQRMMTLPPLDIPTFSGNPLDYNVFIRAFEHGVESRTESLKDRLYFLEQFTSGQPKELIKSCLHMKSDAGYHRAKQLLKEHFGNDYKIAIAYMNKVLNWTPIRPEDTESLNAFSLFLTACCNTMDEVSYMEELDNVANLKAIVAKLPFKLRERWRSVVCGIQERCDRRVKFKDLVEFINKQAKIALHPVFGDIKDSTPAKTPPIQPNYYKEQKKGIIKKSFTTSAIQLDTSKKNTGSVEHTDPASPTTPPCLFCKGEHAIETCSKLKGKPHKEKIEFLRSKGLCFSCLKHGHMSKFCKGKVSCEVCSLTHPTLLHIKKKDIVTYAEKKTDNCDGQTVLSAFVCTQSEGCELTGAGEDDCILAIVPVQVKAKMGNVVLQTYAFMDPGSSATFCTETLMNKLKLSGRKTDILLRTMNEEKPVSTYVVSGLEVSSLSGDEFIDLPDAFTQKTIPVGKENIPQQKDLERWPHLKEIKLPQIEADIGLLIGANVPKAMEPWEVVSSVGNGPYAVRTKLGWTVNGPLRESCSHTGKRTPTKTMANRISVASLENLWLQQFQMDFPEGGKHDEVEMSREDHQFMDIVMDSAKRVDGHYNICLPLKNKMVNMPNNRIMAEQRTQSLRRKFIRNDCFHKEYTDFMDGILQKGYAVQLSDEEMTHKEGKVWYIPHHAVYHPVKQKLRVVFDCAASYQGTSLNEQLLQGPDLTSSLIGVVIRFRQEPVAIMADVEAMFHQVKVPDDDSNLLRFLWWPGGDYNQALTEHKMTVHLFGATSSPSCASFALRKCAEDQSGQFKAEVVQTVLQNFYVDDCLKSVATDEAAISMCQDLMRICAYGGFRLTKWVSNRRKVLDSIPKSELAGEMKTLDLDHDELPLERALGLNWCVESDTFKFKITIRDRPFTRRGLLSVVGSVYDPLGILSPVVLPAKTILQDLCRLKLGWDDDLPEHIKKRWSDWLASLPALENFSFPRCLKPEGFGDYGFAQLHHFADASEYAYGSVSYLLMRSASNKLHCAFMMGKSRVAPLRPPTIPRMELTAATVAVKMDGVLRRELQLDLDQSMFWTDSTVVLRYLQNETTRYRTFVANRVSDILKGSDVEQWRHVGTDKNPADYASRGQRVDEFLKNTSWVSGPEFLCSPVECWPKTPLNNAEITSDDPEIKRIKVNSINVREDVSPFKKLINYFSSWIKLKRTVAWFLKIKVMLWSLCQKREELRAACEEASIDSGQQLIQSQMDSLKESFKNTRISVEDLDEAELRIVKFCQKEKFSEEMSALFKGQNVKRSSHLYKLNPILQDGLLRVGGRLSRAAMPENSKQPVILSRDFHITNLILQQIHEDTGHGGRNHMLSELRQKFWIPSANTAIRKVLGKCVTCRRLHGKAGKQLMADLPQERVLPDDPPFTRVGVDYFGPLEVKRGRSLIKRYGVIFTCLAVRAVHIELASSLDTDSCINALRRFIARRGQVKEIRSDNGTNFVGANRELKAAAANWNSSQFQHLFHQHGIKWSFNPPAASHHGGAWERLIRSIRKVLNSTVREQVLDEESLHTVLCEAESIINSRPITKASSDLNDLEALTPNHLLLLKTKPSLPPGLFDQDDLYTRRRWRQVQYMSNLFWKRWIKEYLPQLQERQRWATASRNFAEGDVVLLVDDCAPRNSWIMGKIVETVPDKKGLVRRVRIKTKTNVLDRPITKICLLLESDYASGKD